MRIGGEIGAVGFAGWPDAAKNALPEINACKDIPDEVFLRAVKDSPGHWRTAMDVGAELDRSLGVPVPGNLFWAKAARLIKRGLLHGCPCKCRGDYHLPEECTGC